MSACFNYYWLVNIIHMKKSFICNNFVAHVQNTKLIWNSRRDLIFKVIDIIFYENILRYVLHPNNNKQNVLMQKCAFYLWKTMVPLICIFVFNWKNIKKIKVWGLQNSSFTSRDFRIICIERKSNLNVAFGCARAYSAQAKRRHIDLISNISLSIFSKRVPRSMLHMKITTKFTLRHQKWNYLEKSNPNTPFSFLFSVFTFLWKLWWARR